jgi:hypothetical protein
VFDRRFTARAMAEAYVKVYEHMLRPQREYVRLVS